MTRGCILWDWNGTLLDDTSAALGALNEMLARRNLPPIGMDWYAALERARSAGLEQVIVSALRHDLLERDVAQYGVGEFFAGLYGTNDLDGASKLVAAKKAAAALPGRRLVVIGDSRHDREAADAVGAACVLQSGGTHTRARLEPFAPVADTLTDAVCLALDGLPDLAR